MKMLFCLRVFGFSLFGFLLLGLPLFGFPLLGGGGCCFAQDGGPIHPLELTAVKIHDPFWSPKLRVWDSITVNDVFDKLEGHYVPDRQDLIDEKAAMGHTRDVLVNFDAVARGDKNTGVHDGPPWYDGLLYETIRGAADLLAQYPDARLEQKIDGIIEHIAAAQAADPDGYLETYTTLTRPNKRWGTHGGDDKWQHDIYNAGMLVEAGVHYYKATGKTKLLIVAVKMANYMSSQMGPAPRLNVIPGHGGPEEALLTLHQLFLAEPALAGRLGVPVHEQQYFELATYWITNRGHYGGPGSPYSRKSDSSYNQDQLPVFEQTTIEGHAVRATLLATGVTAVALENGDTRYSHVAERYWDNMIGKRMFITGGEGAIADGERFGPDYFLPESAYLETCASIGAGFFSERMNELKADGKYMDALERVIYNNLLSGIALDGRHYFYENPLKATDHVRWSWHSCPCCPPMILKMVSAIPRWVYGYNDGGVYVNLFIGSSARLSWRGHPLGISESTQYPWDGGVSITVAPAEATRLALHVRMPGWAMGEENPYGLYSSRLVQRPTLRVNGRLVELRVVNGYAVIDRVWRRGDKVALLLPMQPRVVEAADAVSTLRGKLSVASGPVVYALEATDNAGLSQLTMKAGSPLRVSHRPGLLGGGECARGERF
jgi:DUF1680 family protein